MSQVKPGQETMQPPYPLGTQPPPLPEQNAATKGDRKSANEDEDDRDDDRDRADAEQRPPDDS